MSPMNAANEAGSGPPSRGVARVRLVVQVLVVGSLLAGGFLRALETGMKATPWETTDSLGRPMGFNDPLGAEHYRIALGNVRLGGFIGEGLAGSGCFLLWVAMHVLALVCVGRFDGVRPARLVAFFLAQFLLFPAGFPGLVMNPFLAAEAVRGRVDRETFVDLPFFWVTAHGLWLLVVLVSVFLLFLAHRFHVWGRMRRT